MNKLKKIFSPSFWTDGRILFWLWLLLPIIASLTQLHKYNNYLIFKYTASPWKRSRWDIALMIFAFVLTSLSPSDLMPSFLRRDWIQPFALKSLPIVVIWLKLSFEMLSKQYDSVTCADKKTV